MTGQPPNKSTCLWVSWLLFAFRTKYWHIRPRPRSCPISALEWKIESCWIWIKDPFGLYYSPHLTVYKDNNPVAYVMSTAKLNTLGHQWVWEKVKHWHRHIFPPPLGHGDLWDSLYGGALRWGKCVRLGMEVRQRNGKMWPGLQHSTTLPQTLNHNHVLTCQLSVMMILWGHRERIKP